jgi:hypothetical protein
MTQKQRSLGSYKTRPPRRRCAVCARAKYTFRRWFRKRGEWSCVLAGTPVDPTLGWCVCFIRKPVVSVTCTQLGGVHNKTPLKEATE